MIASLLGPYPEMVILLTPVMPSWLLKPVSGPIPVMPGVAPATLYAWPLSFADPPPDDSGLPLA